jgi:methyl-accepting chemotaxis protein
VTLRYDSRVRRGRLLARATTSPAGIAAGAVLAGVGVATGIAIPWVVGAAVVAWGTSVILHLRDPKLVSALLAPDFQRDLGVLDAEHRRYVLAGLQARERFEEAVSGLPDGEDFGGMKVRVNDALERLYDSIVWAQRAATFLRSAQPESIRNRIQSAGPGTRLAEELAHQLEEVADVERKRAETLARSTATVTGIETLAVKVGSLALDASAPGELGHADDIRQLRGELDGYLEGLEEIQETLRSLPPQIA